MATTTLIPNAMEWLKTLTLAHGSHEAGGAKCFNEAVAFLAREPHSYMPNCMSPVIARFTMRLNDQWDNKRRQQLKPYLTAVIDTAGSHEMDIQRSFLCVDWLYRELFPLVCESHELACCASQLRALPPVTNKANWENARIQAKTIGIDADTAYNYGAYAALFAASYADPTACNYAYTYGTYAGVDLTQKADASALGLLGRLIQVTS